MVNYFTEPSSSICDLNFNNLVRVVPLAAGGMIMNISHAVVE